MTIKLLNSTQRHDHKAFESRLEHAHDLTDEILQRHSVSKGAYAVCVKYINEYMLEINYCHHECHQIQSLVVMNKKDTCANLPSTSLIYRQTARETWGYCLI
jgi:predicted nucleic acid-binding Zn finger protein